jgi:hypothetical protein
LIERKSKSERFRNQHKDEKRDTKKKGSSTRRKKKKERSLKKLQKHASMAETVRN